MRILVITEPQKKFDYSDVVFLNRDGRPRWIAEDRLVSEKPEAIGDQSKLMGGIVRQKMITEA